MRENVSARWRWIPALLLPVLMILAVCGSGRAQAADVDMHTKYSVTVYWTVEEENPDARNKIEIGYWVPDGSGYSGSAWTKTIDTAADTEGAQWATVSLEGPPMYVKLSVYGTQADPGEYHMTRVDVTASSPVTKNGVSNSATLWKGTFGAGVGTKAGTMICSNLHFNHMAPAGSKYPYFTSWVDASTNKATSEGIDRLQRTDSYFEAGCKDPYIAGVTELKVTGSGTFNVPTGNAAATYDLGITPGIAYDCYGARWPVQNTGFTLDSVGKNVQLTSKDGKWYLVVNPDANAASDYNVGVRQSGTSAVKTVTIHTFDYNFSFVDAGGTVIASQTVDYGLDIIPPAIPNADSVVWVCDQYADWQNTKTGPQERIVRASINTQVVVAKPSVKAAKNRKLIIDWTKFRAKMSLRPFWPNTQVVEVQYGTDPSFRNVAGTRAVPKWKLTQGKGKTTLKGLKKNRYYYVRVRLSDGQGVYSRWSPAAKVRTKK